MKTEHWPSMVAYSIAFCVSIPRYLVEQFNYAYSALAACIFKWGGKVWSYRLGAGVWGLEFRVFLRKG